MAEKRNAPSKVRRPTTPLTARSDQRHSENETVVRARRGDPAAMGQLLQIYDPQMRAVAWRILGDRQLMDDVLQDAYLRACRSIRRFRGDAAFGTWLHRVVANSCVDTLKTSSRRHEQTLLPEGEYTQPLRPYDQIVERQTIEQALGELPANHRAVLLLVDYEGYSYKEVADLFGTSTGTVGSWLSRARSNLRTNETLRA